MGARRAGSPEEATWQSSLCGVRNIAAAMVTDAAGSRPGGRDTFLLRSKKVSKEMRPAAPALRASLPPNHQPGRPLNSLRSDNAAGLPRSGGSPLGGAEGYCR